MRCIRGKRVLMVGVGLAMVMSMVGAVFSSTSSAMAMEKITVTYPYYGFVEDPEHPWQSVYDALDEIGTIDYSDGFFDGASFGDHPGLRAASYAVALAGFENEADGYPSTTTDPNPKLVGLLNQMGFSDYQFWDLTSEEDGHSMGTTIGRKNINGQDLVVVAPRNYNYMTEWLSNFNVGESGDHAGFSESAGYIVEHLNQYIASRNLANYKIWMVGYSRGGAVVDLAAKYINNNIGDYQVTPEDFYVYTFGAPRASVTETLYENIHDVKDGNDLLLGYLFPQVWGFYNTGVYEEIHPADLEITTSVVDISDLVDSNRAMNLLSSNNGMMKDVGTMSGKEYVDGFLRFVNDNGLTRDYFNAEVKGPLLALMKVYQMRTLDKQGEVIDFVKDTDHGLAGMVAGNAFIDFMTGGYESLADFSPYQELVKILKGTATDTDVDDFIAHLTNYMGEYSDYIARFGEVPVTEAEFDVMKENLPKLVRALAPIIVADAAYTQATYGEDYSLFYTYTMVENAKNLVIGHIPESIMPILKSLIPPDEEEDDDVKVPNTGVETKKEGERVEDMSWGINVVLAVICVGIWSGWLRQHRL